MKRNRHQRSRTSRGAIVALLALAGGAVAGCSAFFDAPDVRIADVRVTGIGLSGATADVVLEVVNPNGYALTSEGLRYTLEFEDPDRVERGEDDPWRLIAQGEESRRLTVQGDGRATVTVAVPFEYSDVGRAIMSLVRRGEVRYRLSGDVLFDAPVGGVRVPFSDTGSVGL